jgi:hypothetical protein
MPSAATVERVIVVQMKVAATIFAAPKISLTFILVIVAHLQLLYRTGCSVSFVTNDSSKSGGQKEIKDTFPQGRSTLPYAAL